MPRTDVRKLSLKLFALALFTCLLLAVSQTAGAGDQGDPTPSQCNAYRDACVANCPIDPSTNKPEENCAEICRNDHAVCESSAFGASLSPQNFSLPLSPVCPRIYSGYMQRCMDGVYPLLDRHIPIYNACIADGFSVFACCDNVATDLAVGVSVCTEF